MAKQGRKYIYINNLNPDGTVFQTQILDWLHLYKLNNLEFCLIQAFHIKELGRPENLKEQIAILRKCTEFYSGAIYLLPSKSIYYLANAVIIYFKIFKYLFQYSEVLIFSRALIGKEIAFLRKISPARIIFYFDARAASAEENRYMAQKALDFTLKKYKTIANIHYLEYMTLCSAVKIFTVSSILRKYFQFNYNLADKKFVYYPCLSDEKKFFFIPELRTEVRDELSISEQTRIFIYSGGINSAWHLTTCIFSFFRQLLKFEPNSILLCLTQDTMEIEKTLTKFPELKSRLISFNVPNNEVCRYLNAADYGILFRENTIMNNVASPTKFAEYMLCGLPVLISEGVGDYSNYTVENDTGVLIKESELRDFRKVDCISIFEKTFDRKHIAALGKKEFAKSSIIEKIILELE